MDRYHIYEAIGRGKHSVVYKGRRKKTIQYYAIKSVDKSQRPRVLQEVQVLRSVSHRLVLKFHAWYETQNHLWLVLEYCVGGDLLSLLRQDVTLPERSIAAFGRDLITALRTLHCTGTLHCDLKPSNVLVDEDGRLKMCGFGLARRVADVAASSGAEAGPGGGQHASKRGTPCYMAPELFREGGMHSYASDLWALGCILYECAAGKPPFVSSSLSELMEMILGEDPPALDPKVTHPLSPAFKDMLFGLLQKDPARRLSWAQLLQHEFWAQGEAAAELRSAVETAGTLPPHPAFDAYVRSAALADRFDAATVSSAAAAAGPTAAADRRSSRGGVEGGPPEAKEGRDGRSTVEMAHRGSVLRRTTSRSQEVVRLSQVARANLEREEGGAYTSVRTASDVGGPTREDTPSTDAASTSASLRMPRPSASAGRVAGDVELANADAELNFADAPGEDEAAGRPPTAAGVGQTGAAGVASLEGDATVSGAGRGGSGRSRAVGREGAQPGGASRDASSSPEEAEEEADQMMADPGATAAGGEQTAAMEEDGRGGCVQGFAALGGRPASAAGGPEDDAAGAAAASAARASPLVGDSPRQRAHHEADRHVAAGAPPPTREAVHPLPAATPPGVGVSRRNRAGDGAGDLMSNAVGGSAGGDKNGVGKNNPAAATVDGADLPAVDIAELMNHASDSQVKPIVLNRRIELVPEPHFDPEALPFEPLAIADMLAAPQADLEAFLTQIYRSVAHSSPINEKVNTLAYFETLCCDTAAANVLVNSSLMTLFVRMLRASKAPTLRIRLTSCMGLLLRHATYITEELAESGVVTVLTECLKDKNERVRRRAMATLGELLFYIATQQHEATLTNAARMKGVGPGAASGNTAAAWQVPASTVGTITRMLRAGEDEIAQHYAVKTIENIVSHGGEWAAKFASAEVTAALVTIMTGAKGEQLRGTAASTLSRAARSAPAVVQLVLDRYGINLLVTGLRDPSAKVQQASLNLLNRGLGDLGARARAALAAEDKSGSLLPTLVGLLERGSAVLRGKALLTLALLFRLHRRWLLAACGTKLLALVDRLQKDKEPYLQSCMDALVNTVVTLMPKVNEAILAEVDRLAVGSAASRAGATNERERGGANERGSNAYGRPGSNSSSSGGGGGWSAGETPSTPGGHSKPGAVLALFPVLIHLLGSTAFRPRVCDAALLADVAKYLHAAEGSPFPGHQEFRGGVLALLETLSQCAPTLLQMPEAVAGHLLPALADMLGRPDSSADGRFLALKLTCDTLLPLLLDLGGGPEVGSPRATSVVDGVEGVSGGARGNQGQSNARADAHTRRKLSTLLRDDLLPLCPTLLADEDPIPLYALKLLGGALEADRGMCAEVVDLGLAPRFFEFLSLEHTNNNVHNVRLCLVLAESRSVPMASLCAYAAGEKVAAVLSYAHENAVEPFMEPALGICRALLTRAAEAQQLEDADARTVALNGVAPLLQLSPVLVECAAAGETEVAGSAIPQLAANSLRLMVDLLPDEAAAAVFHPHVPLIAAVQAMGSEEAAARGEGGFADADASGSAGGQSTDSPRAGFASAQRVALGVVAAAARRVNERSALGSPGGTASFAGGAGISVVADGPSLEAALRRLARGEPNAGIAAAAAEAADAVAAIVGLTKR